MKLREVREEDLEDFFRFHDDLQSHQMAGMKPRQRAAFFEHWRKNIIGNATGSRQTIEIDGKPAGSLVAWTADGKRLLGYWLDRAHWNKGVLSAALPQFLALETTRSLYAFVSASNAGSIRVLEKSGFVRESSQTVDGILEHFYRLD